MTTARHTIDEILQPFFNSQTTGKKGLTLRRIQEVERHLRACSETEAERILIAPDLAVLAAERQFNPNGAVARVMHADDLVFILSIFVGPEWQPTDPVQRRVQLRITEQLAGVLIRRRLVDRSSLACPIIDIEIGIQRGRDEVRRQQRQARAPF
ncbi:MAG: hypothetical protein WED09_10530 [Homoserinimonas sp.]